MLIKKRVERLKGTKAGSKDRGKRKPVPKQKQSKKKKILKG
jgi:hypothetical protein